MTKPRPQHTTRLQYVGIVPAIPFNELRVGDEVMWNYGHRTTVTAIRPKGKTMITVSYADPSYRDHDRNHRLSALVVAVRGEKYRGLEPEFLTTEPYMPKF